MQWVKKGQAGPVKARVHASRSKQMVLVFFDPKGMIYTNIFPQSETINAEYIKKDVARDFEDF
jgi:CRISPR/Cas system-associated endonuclease Cas1